MLRKKPTGSALVSTLRLIGVIFVAELLVMFLLELLERLLVLSPLAHALMDASALAVVVGPILYLYISRLRKAEEELRQYLDQLEERVRERTAELERANQQLQQDVIEHRQHEELQARFELVFNSVGDGIYLTDIDYKVMLWNNGAERVTGWSAQEVIGKPCAEFLAKEDEQGNHLCGTALCPLRLACDCKETTEARRMFLHAKNGRRLPVAVMACPVVNSESKTVGIVEVFRDISHELEIEQMKSDFVSIVSHELRTPLASIQGFTELLLTRDIPRERQREWLQVMQSESRRLGTLIDGLLDLSRIEAGRINLQPEALDLEPIVSKRFALLQSSLQGHQLRAQLPADLPRVRADHLYLERVLNNLLSNAIKYSPDGGEITVSAQPEGDWVRVSVSDQGIGIPKDKLEAVFERFQQLESFRTRSRGGVGLGLAIARFIVEQLGGRIWAESELGKGSTFHFTLPVEKGGETQDGR